MNPKVDSYFTDGCGRCALWKTPQCNVHHWQKELALLRNLALSCGLTEELKWGVPTYTFQKNNIILLGAFKENCTLSFFKGALLHDAHHLLQKPGENTQAARVIRFTNDQEIIKQKSIIQDYIYEAVEIEKAGLKVEYKKTNDFIVPDELQKKFTASPSLHKAFDALTPGRQRAYLLHFSQAKQSKTRESRIEKFIPHILQGKGMHDL